MRKWSGRDPQPPVISGRTPLVVPPTLPSHIECPKCGANPGFGCHTATGYIAGTHQARWRALGIVDRETQLSLLNDDYDFMRSHRRQLIGEKRT
jgi:hypothetical protein